MHVVSGSPETLSDQQLTISSMLIIHSCISRLVFLTSYSVSIRSMYFSRSHQFHFLLPFPFNFQYAPVVYDSEDFHPRYTYITFLYQKKFRYVPYTTQLFTTRFCCVCTYSSRQNDNRAYNTDLPEKIVRQAKNADQATKSGTE